MIKALLSAPFALSLFLAAIPAQAAPPSKAERTMIATVDAEQARHLALLEKLVNQNSGTRNLAGVRAVHDMLVPEFAALGFTVRWVDQSAVGRAGHFIAEHKGKPGTKRLLLIGHLDTVFELDHPFQKYERISADKARGPGVADDKGGVVAMLAALRAMHKAGTLKDANIEVVLTGDEEEAGLPLSIARADLVAAGKRADAALDFEGLVQDGGTDMGSIARRSAGNWKVTVTARSAHSSGIFSAAAGEGAIYPLAAILTAFRQELPEPNLTFNVGMVAGGASAAIAPSGANAEATGKSNIIPGQAVAMGDLRALTPESIARAEAKMRAIVARPFNGGTAALEFEDKYPPMAPTEGNRALLAKLNGVNATLGLPEMPVLDPLKRGAGDVSFVAVDVDSLAGLGAASSGDHTANETVDIPSLWRQAKRAALLMTRLSREPAVKR
ncbi:M20/M25/M40 family metallo-hydrolase [Novosphingobium sp.]|jgi:glutamate carboxypeptidase|uniref:M20/M25/M40 family metallo-hydrolase n=1 Tax=Novosphingobium sp. TaxID=1874826 RepID=UPI0022C1F632|nr:M20/M25/M40 family metallo-hydrolase [Novosphingobium sp.]MCZ8019031.1 M20/M25/M40 family metallo-hydrolase [Novosphingobium sp.]MCZ8034637.1 M20/M25/M40 family metallo-hydrolase [Novosphingobium sp.]MCZ8052185.1 M20/M25/M40 family metallo-hydrolase [Novosphingobium sp.]MCZ8060111.1 M20/M25/M40 family metallo-hydrolase [Novosphingobium sp.]MCZ8231073.1 M20/M25/M40 family metallo-hydrolase [Novosphingobium sp.]